MPLSKRVQSETLKSQHDELDYIASRLQLTHDCLEVIGLNSGELGELEAYAENLRDVCRKIKAVIESMAEEV